VASLRVAAEEQKLEKILIEKRFRELMMNYFNEKNRSQDAEGFRINPAAPFYFSSFLQYILKERLKLDENESARIGMQVVNIMKRKGSEKYKDIVYFDIDKGEFFWK
jgi:hypothetical protein